MNIGTSVLGVDRKRIINRMRAVSENFYSEAVAIGVHHFIEFNGMLAEYIKILERMSGKGLDPITNAPEADGNNIFYIIEKFDCIFGDSIRRSDEVAKSLVAALQSHGYPVRYVRRVA